jgi:hypothetical protein
MEPFVSEGWRLVHLHGETIQRRVLFPDALMKILALKVSEVRRQQPAIALDIPLMAQRVVVARVCPAERDTTCEQRVKTKSWAGGRTDWRRGFAALPWADAKLRAPRH